MAQSAYCQFFLMAAVQLHQLTCTRDWISNDGTSGNLWRLVVSKWEWLKLIGLSTLWSLVTTAPLIVALFYL